MKKYIIAMLFLPLGMTAAAQTNNGKALLSECQRLHSDGEHATALNMLRRIDMKSLDAGTRQEAELLLALVTFETNALEGRALLLQYIDDYPTAKSGLLNCYIAESYYYTGNYDLACNWFAQGDMERLPQEQRDRARLYYALSMQECGKEDEGIAMLRELAAASKTHADDAQFHLAAADYDKGNLDEAYNGFKKIEFSDKYHLEVPYYLAGIYLKQGDAERAKAVATHFIGDHCDKPQGTRMQQMLGAAEYALGNYAAAVEPLTTYIHGVNEAQRIAYYQLGLSLFETGSDEARAVEMFTYCCNGDGKRSWSDDAITQNSLLHLGIIKLKQNDMQGAGEAFAAAARMDYDSRIKEEAMYNYALCVHQRGSSAFAESSRLFEEFMNAYPGSRHASQAAQYLVEVYMSTQNYSMALQSIERINRPTDDILKAKQKVLYRLGTQELAKGNLKRSVEYLNRSIELKQHDRKTHADAEYWKGEALFGMEEYKGAANSYRNALAAGAGDNGMAMYGLAYSLFQLKNYKDARTSFERFIKNGGGNKELAADAYNRIADCYFYQRDYANADKHYRLASSNSDEGADYAMFRSALTQGLSKDYSGKVATLKQMIAKYPKSSYVEQAYNEMARSYIEQEKFDEAIAAYDSLIKEFPDGELARRAATEKAMIYNNTGNSEKAAQAYMEIIRRHPGSEEALVAIQDLKSIYAEMGKVDEFAKFAAATKGMEGIGSNEIDSLTYVAAEKAYSRGEYDEAARRMQEYLSKFPEGAYSISCNYYLGTMLKEKESKEAARHLQKVYDAEENRYTEEALSVAADIHYAGEEHATAKELYKRLLKRSSNEERNLMARTRIMHSAYALEEYEEAIGYATDIIANGNAGHDAKREALYCRAKANIAIEKEGNAVEDLALLAKDTRTKEGAEAKYLHAQILFDQEDYSDCEKEILDYIEKSTPHTYWLARSFVLLADTYMKQGKTVEAKQYLLSLQSNYEGDDDIAEMIRTRLEKLK